MAQVDKFTVELELGATMKSGEYSFVKPAVSTSITFNGIPEKDQLDTALGFMQKEILEPVLHDVVDAALSYSKKAAGLE